MHGIQKGVPHGIEIFLPLSNTAYDIVSERDLTVEGTCPFDDFPLFNTDCRQCGAPHINGYDRIRRRGEGEGALPLLQNPGGFWHGVGYFNGADAAFEPGDTGNGCAGGKEEFSFRLPDPGKQLYLAFAAPFVQRTCCRQLNPGAAQEICQIFM